MSVVKARDVLVVELAKLLTVIPIMPTVDIKSVITVLLLLQ